MVLYVSRGFDSVTLVIVTSPPVEILEDFFIGVLPEC